MTTTIVVGATSLDLPDDLNWQDENSWAPVEQTVSRSLTGALVISASARQAGRSITLAGADDAAWVPYSTVTQLRNWAASPGQVMVLTLRGQSRNVIFRHQDTAIEAVPIVQYGDVQDADWYRVTLRFMEI